MVSRSLTSVFIMMRNNALQNKKMSKSHLYEDDYEDDDTIALVKDKGKFSRNFDSVVTIQKPAFVEWAEKLNDLKFNLEHITEKMEELHLLHEKHLKRPTLNDEGDEEDRIEIMTREITESFCRCKNVMKVMNQRRSRLNEQEQLLAQNMLSGNATTLQTLSVDFKKAQSNYLKKLKKREERSHEFFIHDTDLMIGQTYEDDIDDVSFERGITNDQVVAIDNNSALVEARENEIQTVVKSITELSEIFQDLGSIIVEQSGIIDRIDYNIENAVVQTETGLEELQKAENYQKKNKKMLIIVVMAGITLIMLLILILTH